MVTFTVDLRLLHINFFSVIFCAKHNFFFFLFKVGDGRPSDILRTKTAGSSPLAGGREGVVKANTSWAAVSLAQWTDGGCPISHYSVAYRRSSSNTWVIGKS